MQEQALLTMNSEEPASGGPRDSFDKYPGKAYGGKAAAFFAGIVTRRNMVQKLCRRIWRAAFTLMWKQRLRRGPVQVDCEFKEEARL